MPGAVEILAYAAGGLAVTEATGVTNITGGSSDGSNQQSDGSGFGKQLGEIIGSVNQQGEAISQTQESLQETQESLQSVSERLSTVSQTAQAARVVASSGSPGAVRQVQPVVKEVTRTVRNTTQSNGPDKPRETTPTRPQKPKPNSGPPNPASNSGESYDIQQDYTGFLGQEIRGGAEILEETGKTATDVTDTVVGESESGATVVEPVYNVGKSVGKAVQTLGQGPPDNTVSTNTSDSRNSPSIGGVGGDPITNTGGDSGPSGTKSSSTLQKGKDMIDNSPVDIGDPLGGLGSDKKGEKKISRPL